jgi:large subunit ribosomal protein L15
MLNTLKARKSHSKKKTRLGRGFGSAHGGHTATRGNKGQKSRSGHKKVPWYFEGGQLPFVKRLPHLPGFKNYSKKQFGILKTSKINSLGKKTLTPKDLVGLGMFKKLTRDGVKVLLDEEVKIAVKMTGFKYSKSAKKAIEKAGGVAN